MLCGMVRNGAAAVVDGAHGGCLAGPKGLAGPACDDAHSSIPRRPAAPLLQQMEPHP